MTDGPIPLIDVVIVTHDSGAVLADCIQELVGDATPNDLACTITVVDSGSPDLEYLDHLPPTIRLVRCPNIGYGSAANRGIAHGSSPWVVVMNPDVRVSVAGLMRLRDHAVENDLSAIAPVLLDVEGVQREVQVREICPPWRRRGRVDMADRVDHQEVEVLQGSVMVLARPAFEAVGGFDEEFFLYAEEDDLVHRLRSSGHHAAVLLSEYATHIGEGSSERVPPEWRLAQRLRGRTKFVAKHYSKPEAAIAYAQSLIRIASSLGPRPGLRVLLISVRETRRAHAKTLDSALPASSG